MPFADLTNQLISNFSQSLTWVFEKRCHFDSTNFLNVFKIQFVAGQLRTEKYLKRNLNLSCHATSYIFALSRAIGDAARSAVGRTSVSLSTSTDKTDQNSRATQLKMETQYYNLIPPLAKSEDLGPVSPGSDDSGVQDEQPSSRPQRPPRSIDCTTPSKLPMHSYINLGLGAVPSTPPKLDFSGVSIPNTPPPTLPKRMPYLVQSPTLNHKSSHLPLQRSASSHSTRDRGRNRQQSQGIAKGICKCKVATRQVNSECTTEAGKKNCF